MRRLLFTPLLTLLLILPAINELQAQTEHADSVKAKQNINSSYAEAGISYSSNIVFAGRKDSVAVPYLGPSIGYSHKSGVFVKGALYYLTSSSESRIDLFTLGAGYMYNKNNLLTGFSVNKYFFNGSSTNVQSQMDGYASVFAGYNFNDILTVYIDGMVSFAENPDYILGSELNHTFYAAKDQLKITPTIYVNFGTQNYYNEFYTAKRISTGGGGGSGNGNGNGNGNGGNGSSGTTTITTVTVSQSTKFQMLDYEFSLPVSYSYKKFTVFSTPVLAIPVSPSSYTVDGETFAENLSNSFYWILGITYRFGGK